jgi:hypothetical protein
MDMETLRIMRKLTVDEKNSPYVKHALEVRKSLASGNYGRFFKQYNDAPNMGRYLMEVFIQKHRILCLTRLTFANQVCNLDLHKI